MSFVGYIYDPAGPIPFKCGYCKSPDTSRTQGVWAYGMTCRDYQDLVDRGFQRSGKYVYRAFMKRTCCPQYVIRTDVTKFRLSKSQRGVVRKLHRYLLHGRTAACTNSVGDRTEAHAQTDPMTSSEEELMVATPEPEARMDGTQPTDVPVSITHTPKAAVEVQQQTTAMDHTAPAGSAAGIIIAESRSKTAGEESTAKASELSPGLSETPTQSQSQQPPHQPNLKPAVFKKPRKPVRLGAGADPNKPPCRKAKLVRRERKAQKLAEKQRDIETKQPSPQSEDPNSPLSSTAGSSSSTTVAHTAPPQPKLFEQLLEETLAVPSAEKEYTHRLDIRLVQCSPRSQAFKDTFEESCAVFKKFQTTIHKEQEADCGERQFLEFLVDSPLIPEEPSEGMPCGYGSYHQQYLLDGKIVAVGVLDFLPRGVLCEYLYYDPDYRFIAPGVFTALQEISLAQRFRRLKPEMQFYYMGFYVQSCPKMNYKSRYDASYLLCPETYTYVPIKNCIPKLLASPYSRLAEEEVPDGDGPLPEGSLDNVQVFEMAPIAYERYKALHGERKQSLVEDYVRVVGLELALRMRLFLGRMML